MSNQHFTPAQVNRVSPETGKPILGIALVGHPSISGFSPGYVTNGTESLEIPFKFYTGDLELVRAELIQVVNQAIDRLHEAFDAR